MLMMFRFVGPVDLLFPESKPVSLALVNPHSFFYRAKESPCRQTLSLSDLPKQSMLSHGLDLSPSRNPTTYHYPAPRSATRRFGGSPKHEHTQSNVKLPVDGPAFCIPLRIDFTLGCQSLLLPAPCSSNCTSATLEPWAKELGLSTTITPQHPGIRAARASASSAATASSFSVPLQDGLVCSPQHIIPGVPSNAGGPLQLTVETRVDGVRHFAAQFVVLSRDCEPPIHCYYGTQGWRHPTPSPGCGVPSDRCTQGASLTTKPAEEECSELSHHLPQCSVQQCFVSSPTYRTWWDLVVPSPISTTVM